MFHKIFRTIHHPPPRVIIAPNGAAFRFGRGGSGRGFSGSRENQLPPLLSPPLLEMLIAVKRGRLSKDDLVLVKEIYI